MKKYTFYVTHYFNKWNEDRYILLDTRDNFQIDGINKDALKAYIGTMHTANKTYSVHYTSIPRHLNKIKQIFT